MCTRWPKHAKARFISFHFTGDILYKFWRCRYIMQSAPVAYITRSLVTYHNTCICGCMLTCTFLKLYPVWPWWLSVTDLNRLQNWLNPFCAAVLPWLLRPGNRNATTYHQNTVGAILGVCKVLPVNTRPMLGWCWTSVVDDGPTSNQHRLNASCLLNHVNCIAVYRQ